MILYMTTQTLTALTETQPTATLLAALAVLDEKGWLDEAERLTNAVISDVLCERHELDATLEAIYFADDFDGTYFDALVMAMAVEAVEA